MRIDILTLFPKMFEGPFSKSIIKRACDKGLIKIDIHNLRDWAKDKHKTVDDKPYGGGAGMVMRVDIIDRALSDIKVKRQNEKGKTTRQKAKVILLSPAGKVFNQKMARRLTKEKHLIFICGHYEGVDARVSKLADEEISIGEYVLTGGELPAMVMVDAVTRLLPGVLGKKESLLEESFSPSIENYLEYPQYTRPEVYKKMRVPKVLLSGDHKKIRTWRSQNLFSRRSSK